MAEREWLPDPTGRHPFRARTNGDWSDLVAISVNGDGIETDTQGGRDARAGVSAAEAATAGAATTNVAATKGKGLGCGWLFLGGGALIVVLIVSSVIRTSATATTYVAAAEYQVENPASVRVFVSVTNTGEHTGTPECKVRVSDPSGAYSGFDIFEPVGSITPGETSTFHGAVVVRNQGAAFVDKVTVDCD